MVLFFYGFAYIGQYIFPCLTWEAHSILVCQYELDQLKKKKKIKGGKSEEDVDMLLVQDTSLKALESEATMERECCLPF